MKKNDRVSFQIRMEVELNCLLKKHAKKSGLKCSLLIDRYLREGLRRDGIEIADFVDPHKRRGSGRPKGSKKKK